MSLQEIVDFVQTNFGEFQGMPNLPNIRPRLPDWLEGRIGEAVRIDPGDRPIIEEPVNKRPTPSGSPNGTSVEELFAYYLPFHYYKKEWGIYIRGYGIAWLARLLTSSASITLSSVLFALRLLLEHERLHFLAEVAASRIEVAFGQQSYAPYFRDPSAVNHEEALANAYAFSSGKRSTSAPLVHAAYTWMSNQGMGYRDFHKWLGRHLATGKRNAAEFMLHKPRSAPPIASVTPRGRQRQVMSTRSGRSHSSRSHPGVPTGPSEFLFHSPSRPQPPTYLVMDVPVPWLRIVRPFPKLFGLQILVHTNDHKPPHVHIRVLRRQETRYEWPVLRPLRGDPPLSKSCEKRLQQYMQRYRNEIEAKIKSVVWT